MVCELYLNKPVIFFEIIKRGDEGCVMICSGRAG